MNALNYMICLYYLVNSRLYPTPIPHLSDSTITSDICQYWQHEKIILDASKCYVSMKIEHFA
jgi:hypothetical protein